MSAFQVWCVVAVGVLIAIVIGAIFAFTPAAPAAPTVPEPDEEHLRALARDPAVVAAGAALFPKYCAACHGAQGQGLLGPNLRDNYWLHGSDMGDIVKSIRDGYPARGMYAWSAYYTPDQIHALAAFVANLHGTEDGTGKAPEGVSAPITYALAAPTGSAATRSAPAK